MLHRVTKGSHSELTQSHSQNTEHWKPQVAGRRYVSNIRNDRNDSNDGNDGNDSNDGNVHIARIASCDKCIDNNGASHADDRRRSPYIKGQDTRFDPCVCRLARTSGCTGRL
ncbi:MAG: hypothetical protein JWR21_1189 [Herminiimonas sp.]|nr:hypothetical protein [Herminiimonas sp.]